VCKGFIATLLSLIIAASVFGSAGAADTPDTMVRWTADMGDSCAGPRTQVWHRTDEVISVFANDGTSMPHTWIWGINGITPTLAEPYAEYPGGQRPVVYFDKARMECNPDAADPLWRVTNGLLVEELITGTKQLGDNTFEQDQPFVSNVVGDPGQDGLTYDELQPLLAYQPIPNGWTIIQTADASGQIGADEHFASSGVTALDVGAPTQHTVASVFWNFLNMTTTIEDNGQLVSGKLYDNPFYITGYPITEAYWTTARVNNQQTEVLVQCFERRCLTYTPSNTDQWKVEFGNAGRHYLVWRYGENYQLP